MPTVKKKYKISQSSAWYDGKNSGFGVRQINLSLGMPLDLVM